MTRFKKQHISAKQRENRCRGFTPTPIPSKKGVMKKGDYRDVTQKSGKDTLVKIGVSPAVAGRGFTPTPINARKIGVSPATAGRGFTLIETMVAISLLVVSVAAPMSLAVRSLSSAFYARDQVTAFHLAQEAIESIRIVRDGNALRAVQGASVDLLAGIPSTQGFPFTVDTRNNAMSLCDPAGCEPLYNNGEFYGHESGSGWEVTRFTRTVTANEVDENGDEIKVSVEVRWKSGTFQERSFTISENLYKWVGDGS
ncbi:hypothetical protein COU13_01890 [Candidatus Kaiserbacteria bacterium CG10_big_fil_rev_8_21_14_0_10_43_70]|uniref:Prepilin-type N-terminal cleavage/methylation domain-containing protein n=1 Tax=Candidatus Kaiserbacteria bacterium CG10_big_fil_rev_8_21_14_0_10_43_70 TaxID=1974605 RepID=A0A2H0UIP0_9BACT|nr:MAG: hypothetical protein COU13_01890 [Candidatus Kaiserbacteria bacterium CG10_big_fil_rev_8_21_14_0_10_43_70]